LSRFNGETQWCNFSFLLTRISFCFEEQRLGPHEEVDMPVFFYVDPDILDDHRLDDVSSLTLSYTFFRAKDQLALLQHEPQPAHKD
jgi:cytochrome c oxidase assembly protein Cox11